MISKIATALAAALVFASLPSTGTLAGGVYGDAVKQVPGNRANAPGLPGVELKFCPAAGGNGCATTVTGSDGSFYVPNLAPGRYKIMTDSREGGVSGTVVVPSGNDIGITVKVP